MTYEVPAGEVIAAAREKGFEGCKAKFARSEGREEAFWATAARMALRAEIFGWPTIKLGETMAAEARRINMASIRGPQ